MLHSKVIVVVTVNVMYEELTSTVPEGRFSHAVVSDISDNLAARSSPTIIRGPLNM